MRVSNKFIYPFKNLADREAQCPVCKNIFTTKHPTKVYCTPKCTEKYKYREKKKNSPNI